MSDVPSQTAALPLGEFRVGRVLSRALEILLGDFAKFLLVAVLVIAPGTLLTANGGGLRVASVFGLPATTPIQTAYYSIALVALVSFPFRTLSQAVTLYGALQDMRGRPFRLDEAFGRGFARFLPLLGLVIAWDVAVFVGTILLIAPGFMLLASFYVSLPACMMEGLGPLQSMSRSAALTKGHRWKVFGIYLLIGAASWIIGSGIRAGFGAMGLAVGGLLAAAVWNTLFAAYHSIIVAVMYHDLRVLKDGIDIEQIAAVFD